ncbi:unnamed protein product [Caenorhabditis angaria]|uniref:Transthyretin-like family protein n=1 Tax=Caenorhabditis angaria TaxID=860376 RepID=A0A9P1IFF3_9PELO|nr:unnamed protein product [Caenorhabditis angaria]
MQGTIRCNLHDTFTAFIQIVEEDSSYTFSDIIKEKVWTNKPSNITHNFSIRGTYEEGDGLFDDGMYEPLLFIRHTCMDQINRVGNVYRTFKPVPQTAASANFTGLTIKLDNREDCCS